MRTCTQALDHDPWKMGQYLTTGLCGSLRELPYLDYDLCSTSHASSEHGITIGYNGDCPLFVPFSLTHLSRTFGGLPSLARLT